MGVFLNQEALKDPKIVRLFLQGHEERLPILRNSYAALWQCLADLDRSHCSGLGPAWQGALAESGALNSGTLGT